MSSLSKEGVYKISEEMKKELSDFYGNYASEEETAAVISEIYKSSGYILDTHTAVAASVYRKYIAETGDNTKTVIASTASPFKFTRSVMTAIDEKYDAMDDFALVDELSLLSGVKVPQAIEDIRTAPVLHKKECAAEEMKKMVREELGVE